MSVQVGDDLHGAEQVLSRGAQLERATGVLILLHGRGGSATDMLALGQELSQADTALLAPQAAGHTWYPNSFLAPLSQNEPWLTSALKRVETLVQQCSAAGVPAERIGIVGFSQGACLASEFAARQPRQYAAIVAFTGGLLGPLGSDLHHAGSLQGTSVLFSSGDPDPHVPWRRVEETAEEFWSMGALVRTTRLKGRPHTILPEEIRAARELLHDKAS